jgi:N-acyl-D-amino-acid deacylase
MAAMRRLRQVASHVDHAGTVEPSRTAAKGEEVDLVIRDVTIVDGTGSDAFVGDVAVSAGKLVQVGGGFLGAAAESIDGHGKYLTPGFIDIHTHFDPQLCWDGRADPSLQHGVTTVVIGNCSLSLAPVADKAAADRIIGMFGRIEDIKRPTFEAAVPFDSWYGTSGSFGSYLDHIKPGLSINVGALIGHSAVRLAVMGEESQEREATQDEIDEMAALIEEAMQVGAIGVSSSYADTDEFGRPVPSRFSSIHEKCELAAAMGRSGRGVWEVVPVLSPEGTVETCRELGQISRTANVPTSFQPILTNPGDPERRDVLSVLEEESAQGARVWAQSTPRDFNMNCRLNETSMLLMGTPVWNETMKLDDDARLAAFRDPQHQEELVAAMEAQQEMMRKLNGGRRPSSGFGIGSTTVGEVSHADNQQYVGRNVSEIAETEGKPLGRVLLDISLRDDLNSEYKLEGVLNADKQAVAQIVKHPLVHLGASDAGAHITQFCGTGDTTFFLEQYVLKDGTLTLEQAVHQLTGVLAEGWGVQDRGVLEAGKAADLNLIDLGKLHNEEQEYVDDMPGNAMRYTRKATGFEGVWVNGTRVLEKDSYLPLQPGCGMIV